MEGGATLNELWIAGPQKAVKGNYMSVYQLTKMRYVQLSYNINIGKRG